MYIENEYAVGLDPSYMVALADKYKKDGMTVPTTFNDPWTGGHWATGEGAVDIYGWDSYPVLFDCSHPDVWPSNVSTYFRDFHASTNPTEPMALYEFQGGAIDGWGVRIPLYINFNFNELLLTINLGGWF
jgi:Glycosyl hydrolases family 35